MQNRDARLVYVVDDDTEVRSSVSRLLKEVSIPVETYPSAHEFLEAYDPDRSALLILDVRMPHMSGLQLLRVLHDRGETLPVIMITGHGDIPMAVEAMQHGAIDFIEKPFRTQHLFDRVLQGLSRAAAMRRERRRLNDAAERWARLSIEERDIAYLFTDGLTNKEIAGRLGVSPQAVDARRHRILDKLGVPTVADLIKLILLAETASSPVDLQPGLDTSNAAVG